MPPQSYEFGSGVLVRLRRLAIRAAKFEPEADVVTWTVSEIHGEGISVAEKNEGPLRGQIVLLLMSLCLCWLVPKSSKVNERLGTSLARSSQRSAWSKSSFTGRKCNSPRGS
jgi:hypothetical protein